MTVSASAAPSSPAADAAGYKHEVRLRGLSGGAEPAQVGLVILARGCIRRPAGLRVHPQQYGWVGQY